MDEGLPMPYCKPGILYSTIMFQLIRMDTFHKDINELRVNSANSINDFLRQCNVNKRYS